MSTSHKQEQTGSVIDLFPTPAARSVPPLTDAEICQLRMFMAEFAIIRVTCPMAVMALSKR